MYALALTLPMQENRALSVVVLLMFLYKSDLNEHISYVNMNIIASWFTSVLKQGMTSRKTNGKRKQLSQTYTLKKV